MNDFQGFVGTMMNMGHIYLKMSLNAQCLDQERYISLGPRYFWYVVVFRQLVQSLVELHHLLHVVQLRLLLDLIHLLLPLLLQPGNFNRSLPPEEIFALSKVVALTSSAIVPTVDSYALVRLTTLSCVSPVPVGRTKI